MNGNGIGRIEGLNQIVRAVCVLILLTAFVFAFLWGVIYRNPIISADGFAGVVMFALQWWFKSRDEQAAQAARAAQPPNFVPPGGGSNA